MAAWLLCPVVVSVALDAHSSNNSRLACTVSSDQQKGTVLKFDADAKVLVWGEGKPQTMTLEVDIADPFELKAVSQRQDFPEVSLHIWSEGDILRFSANAGDSFFVGACKPLS